MTPTENDSKPPNERQHVLASAGYWFKASRLAQDEGRHADAVMAMENACNHAENALAASIDLLRAAHHCMGNTAFPALAARVARFLEQFPRDDVRKGS